MRCQVNKTKTYYASQQQYLKLYAGGGGPAESCTKQYFSGFDGDFVIIILIHPTHTKSKYIMAKKSLPFTTNKLLYTCIKESLLL